MTEISSGCPVCHAIEKYGLRPLAGIGFGDYNQYLVDKSSGRFDGEPRSSIELAENINRDMFRELIREYRPPPTAVTLNRFLNQLTDPDTDHVIPEPENVPDTDRVISELDNVPGDRIDELVEHELVTATDIEQHLDHLLDGDDPDTP